MICDTRNYAKNETTMDRRKKYVLDAKKCIKQRERHMNRAKLKTYVPAKFDGALLFEQKLVRYRCWSAV